MGEPRDARRVAREDDAFARRAPIIALAVLVVAAVAVGAGALALGGGRMPWEPETPEAFTVGQGNLASNIALGLGRVASAEGWDYFATGTGAQVYRAKSDGSDVTLVYEAASADAPSYVSSLNLFGDRVFFVLSTYLDSSVESSVHSMSLDGGDDTVVYAPSTDDGPCSIEQLYVYDGALYVVTLGNRGAAQVYRVLTMGADGTGARTLAEVQSTGVCAFTVSPDVVYYASSDASLDGDGAVRGSVYAVSSADEEPRLVYESEVGLIGSVVLQDGELYVTESDYSAGRHLVCAMGEDGSGRRVVYEAPSGSLISSSALFSDTLFVALYDADSAEGTPDDVFAVPLDGGDPVGFSCPEGYSHVLVNAAGDRLFIAGNGMSMGEDASLVGSVLPDGSGYVELVSA